MTGQAPSHLNNIGALRLLLALLVVFSHVPELLDGDRGRELLTIAFGTLSFGELAVDGFFLISGYLVTQSWVGGGGGGPYFVRRILRIYPGFLAAYAVSLLVFGPLSGGDLSALGPEGPAAAVLRAVLLLPPPDLPGAFPGTPTPALNGSLGTIAYEFRCYLLVALFAATGLLKRRRLFLALALGALVAGRMLPTDYTAPLAVEVMLGDPLRSLRLGSVFMVGVGFFLYRDRLAPTAEGAALAAAALLMAMLTPLAHVAAATLGAYCLFWLAFGLRSPRLQRINAKDDLSYGVYLYAWPITNALAAWQPAMSPWLMAGVVAVLSLCAGWVSWRLIERPALKLKGLAGSRPEALAPA